MFLAMNDSQDEEILPSFKDIKLSGVINKPMANRMSLCCDGERNHSDDTPNNCAPTFQNDLHPCNICSSLNMAAGDYVGRDSSEADDLFEVDELHESKNDHH